MKDRRRDTRYPTNYKARYLIPENQSDWNKCVIINVSYAGMAVRFNTSSSLDLGTTIKLTIPIGKEDELLNVMGTLMWLEKGVNFFVGGVKLTESLNSITLLRLL